MMQAILFALATWFVPSAALEPPFVGSSFWLGLEFRSLKLSSSVGEFESDIAIDWMYRFVKAVKAGQER